LIYPSARATTLAAAGVLPAFLVALLFPAHWYAGLLWIAFVIALTLVDAVAGPRIGDLKLAIEAPATAQVGEALSIDVSARFPQGSSPGTIEAVIGHDERLATSGSRKAFATGGTASLTFRAVRRGIAQLDTLWLRWRGPFGLAWKQHREPLDRHIAVLPDIRPARHEAVQLFRRDALQGEMAQLETGAGSEFQSLAEFRSGMDRRAIDWKHSARHAELLAKEYRTERNNNIVFAIDGGRLMCEPVEGLPKIDRAVAAALLSAFVALRLGDRVSLFGFDARPRIASGSVAGIASFALFQKLAAQLDYSSEETNYTLALTTLATRLDRRSLIVVFTEFVDPTSAELMVRTVGRLVERHLVLFMLMKDVELEGLAGAPPETTDAVARAVTAAALLRERRIVIGRLTRLGVHIVEAAPDRLGPELVNAYVGLKRRDLL
jgi:uncharacterized protein (DUF58 family)